MTPTELQQLALVDGTGGVQFGVKVVPGASRTKVMGLLGDALKLAVAAPPEGGKANRAVVALLAEALGADRANVQIVSGQTQPLKRVFIAGLNAAQVRERLARIELKPR